MYAAPQDEKLLEHTQQQHVLYQQEQQILHQQIQVHEHTHTHPVYILIRTYEYNIIYIPSGCFFVGPFFGTRRKPAQSSYPPATKVQNAHTGFVLIFKQNIYPVLCVRLSLRLRIQPSSPPPTHPSNHLFNPANQSPPPGSQGMMPAHGSTRLSESPSFYSTLIKKLKEKFFFFFCPQVDPSSTPLICTNHPAAARPLPPCPA